MHVRAGMSLKNNLDSFCEDLKFWKDLLNSDGWWSINWMLEKFEFFCVNCQILLRKKLIIPIIFFFGKYSLDSLVKVNLSIIDIVGIPRILLSDHIQWALQIKSYKLHSRKSFNSDVSPRFWLDKRTQLLKYFYDIESCFFNNTRGQLLGLNEKSFAKLPVLVPFHYDSNKTMD